MASLLCGYDIMRLATSTIANNIAYEMSPKGILKGLCPSFFKVEEAL